MAQRFPLVRWACVLFTPAILMLGGCGGSSINPMNSGMAAHGMPPTVSAVATQVNGVAPNREQEVQFSEPMDPATINAQSFKITDASGNAATGAVTYDSDLETASFMPSPALAANRTYTATITTAATSADGAHLASPYTFGFTTRASTDTSPLSANSVNPAANATCVSATTLITITFNEVPDASTVTAANFAVKGPSGPVAVKLSTNVTTTQVVLTPTAALPSGAISVTVNNVADLAGVKMTAPFTWGFSTACSGGGGTGGGGGGATTQYQSPLFTFVGITQNGNMVGQVTVDTTGSTTVTLSGAPASTSYTVQFCPAYADASGINAPPCFDVSKVSTDSSGNGTATAKFPRSGNWAGDFYLNDSAGNTMYETRLSPNVTTQTYMAKLLPDMATNGGVVSPYSPQEPLSSGTVTYSNGSLQVAVSGALPSTVYDISESISVFLNGSGTFPLGTFSTDSSSNGTASAQLDFLGGDMIQVAAQNQTQAGYIAGFTVPQ